MKTNNTTTKVTPASAGATTTQVKLAKTSKGAASTDSQIRVKHSPPRSNNGGADKAKAKTKAAKSAGGTAPTTAMPSVPKGLRQPVVDACDGLPHVRGGPEFLNPDGIRSLEAHGIQDIGVHAEALLPNFRAARGSKGKELAAGLEEAIAKVRSGHGGVQVVPHTDAGSGHDWKVTRVMTQGRLTTYRAFHRDRGEFLCILLGTRFWIAAESVAHRLRTEIRTLIGLAQSWTCLRVNNSDLAGADDESGSTIFMAFEAAERLLDIRLLYYSMRDDLKSTLNNTVLSVENQLESGLTVWASILHGMLGAHLDFVPWARDCIWKSGASLPRLDCCYFDLSGGEDFELAMTEAAEIAKQAGGVAGEIVYTMLSNGGYFHGGPLNESPDETLIRLRDLVPDRHGLLDARKVHEFSNDSRTFVNWVLDTALGSGYPSVCSDRISLSEAEERGSIWLNFWEQRFLRENVRDFDPTIG